MPLQLRREGLKRAARDKLKQQASAALRCNDVLTVLGPSSPSRKRAIGLDPRNGRSAGTEEFDIECAPAELILRSRNFYFMLEHIGNSLSSPSGKLELAFLRRAVHGKE